MWRCCHVGGDVILIAPMSSRPLPCRPDHFHVILSEAKDLPAWSRSVRRPASPRGFLSPGREILRRCAPQDDMEGSRSLRHSASPRGSSRLVGRSFGALRLRVTWRGRGGLGIGTGFGGASQDDTPRHLSHRRRSVTPYVPQPLAPTARFWRYCNVGHRQVATMSVGAVRELRFPQPLRPLWRSVASSVGRTAGGASQE